jgi:hypothetical protein
MKIKDYYMIYCYRRKHRALKKRSPYQYIKTFYPEFADKHPFAFSDSLASVALEKALESVATCLALDKETDEMVVWWSCVEILQFFFGSQEVIGSIPICSTQIINGASTRFVALPFLPEFC